MRRELALITAVACVLACWGATTLRGASTPDTGVTVGSARVAPAAIEAEAARLAGRRPRRLPAARRAAADRAIERLWLEGEAADRGLRAEPDLARLRAEVADALAGAEPERDASRFAQAFGAFHERWRSRTRCEVAYHDPYADRCGNRAGATAGTCRWMGEATLCALSGDGRARWLVVQDRVSARSSWRGAKGLPRRLASRVRHARAEAGSVVVRLRSHAGARAIALAVYVSARGVREKASRRARRARAAATAARAAAATRARRARAAATAARAAAARSETRARERAARARDPRLSERAVSSARAACARQVADSDPYLFGFGMQDVVGAAEGLIAARTELARRLAGSAQDVFDRRKLRPLVRAVAEGNRELARLARAEAGGDHAAAARLVARFDARTESERTLARRLDLGYCLVRPAH